MGQGGGHAVVQFELCCVDISGPLPVHLYETAPPGVGEAMMRVTLVRERSEVKAFDMLAAGLLLLLLVATLLP